MGGKTGIKKAAKRGETEKDPENALVGLQGLG